MYVLPFIIKRAPVFCGALVSLSFFCFSSARADFKDDIDYTKLRNEYGSSLPTGASVRLMQTEYLRSGAWAPSATGELAGKALIYANITLDRVSSHANEVGAFLAGSTTSITPAVPGWVAFEATNYMGPLSLYNGYIFSPLPATWDVENHSWGGYDAIDSVRVLRRLDFRIERDNVVAVVGVDNGPTLSYLLGNSYNSIAVGTSTGSHPQSGTNQEVIGRSKPDLVGTATWTSYATPIVSSCAMLMIDEINRTPSLSAARNSVGIKALLMAGATKSEFPGWQNTTTRPLDPIWGAGEVNIYNSYKMLVAGQSTASTGSLVGERGWDVNTTSVSPRRLYYINVPAGKMMNLSAVLAWYRHINPGSNWLTPISTVQNLDLVLYQAGSNYSIGAEVTRSASTIDNVEHIFRRSLSAGTYVLEVTAPVVGEVYGLAWNGELADDPNSPPPPPPPPPSGFAAAYSSADIGIVGAAGSTSYDSSSGAFTLAGAGADLVAFRDSFQFASATTSGDIEIVASIESFSASDSAAKAGVMIRESSATNSAHASVVVTAANTVAFTRRVITGTSTTTSSVSGISLPVLVKLRRVGNVVGAYYSTNSGSVWSSLGSVDVTMRSPVQTGLVVTSRNPSVLATARFTQVALNTSVSGIGLSGLSLFEVGLSKVSAGASISGNVLSLAGTGYVLPGSSNREGIAFLCKRSDGDAAISTEVLAPRPGAVPMRVGMMVRDSLLDNSAYVSLARTSSGHVVVDYRTTNGGYALTRTFSDSGRHLLLDRRGNTFTAMVSSDGITWRNLTSVSVYLRRNSYQGLYLISSSQTTPLTADFDSFDTLP